MGTNIQLSPVVDDKDSDDDEQDSEADEKPTLLIESFEELQEQEKKEMSREIRDIRTTAQYQYEGHSTLGWCSPDRTVRIRSPPLAHAEHPNCNSKPDFRHGAALPAHWGSRGLPGRGPLRAHTGREGALTGNRPASGRALCAPRPAG